MIDPEGGKAGASEFRLPSWLRRAAEQTGAPPDAAAAAPAAAPPPEQHADFVEQHLIDPARARIWPGNARSYQLLTEADCRSLIDSIVTEGGQRMPATVRRVFGDPDHDYEVVVGTRRHFSISWLRANGHPDLGFLVQVEQLDDETAFRLADLENRARDDVSDVERARNYADALATHYGGHLTQMATRLAISKGWLSKMLKLAALPEPVLAAFADPRALRLKAGYALARAIEEDTARRRAIAAAVQIGRAQVARRADGLPPYSVAEVIAALMDAVNSASRAEAFVHPGPDGKPLLSVVSTSRRGTTLRLAHNPAASRDDILAAVSAALDALALGAG